MSIHRGCLPWQNLTQKIAKLTRACRQTVVGLLFVSVDHGAAIRRATYLCLYCAKNVDKNWNITVSFIIHVNFDHAWAEHYPVTLSGSVIVVASSIIIYTVKLDTMHIHNNNYSALGIGNLKKMAGGPTVARGDCVEHCGWS